MESTNLKGNLPESDKGVFYFATFRAGKSLLFVRLVPGMYEEFEKDGILFVLPKLSGYNYILPLDIKRISNNYRAIIVALNGTHL